MTDIQNVPDYVRPKFTPQQCSDCRKALRILADIEPLFHLAEKCGVDCTAMKAANGQLRTALEAVNHYFMSDE